jgi:penicillin-insensitive murein DD-endopeptidase
MDRHFNLFFGAGAVLLLALWAGVYHGNDLLIRFEDDAPSVSHGTTRRGSIEHPKRLPTSGPNYITYSRLGAFIGRQYVHEQLRAAVLAAYAGVAGERPDLFFVLGETGTRRGGRMQPHSLHRNGLTVDFMVPVRRAGEVVEIPSHAFNRYAYGIRFDSTGVAGDLRIDFDAVALHLDHLQQAARDHGVEISRVHFEPALQRHLFATPRGAGLRERMRFSRKPGRKPNDDHYCVDFKLAE